MIEIKNLRNEQPNPKNIWQVRVDRTSVLGNPISLVCEADRDMVCDKYDVYLEDMLNETCNQEMISEFLRLCRIYGHKGKLELFCWCEPLRCHSWSIRDRIYDQVGESEHPDKFQSEE